MKNIMRILMLQLASLAMVAAQNCNLQVPAAPLTAAGMASLWKLSTTTGSAAPCSSTSFGGSVFCEITVFDPATNTFSAYFCLVVNDPNNAAANPAGKVATAAQAVAVGATGYPGGAAVAPIVPVLPPNAISIIYIGGNNGITTLTPTITNGVSSLTQGNCVNGASATDLFGEYAYCNAAAFWGAVNPQLAKKAIKVPALGTTIKGVPCPTVRSFSMVDQDQSDNVLSSQLLVQTVVTNANTGLTTTTVGLQVAQDTVANRNALNVIGAVLNASDNRLVGVNVLQAVGCTPFQVVNLAEVVNKVNQGPLVTTQALQEITALTFPETPAALVPAGDPMAMTTTNGNTAPNLTKLNLYRAGVNQTPATSLNDPTAVTATYCANMVAAAPKFLAMHADVLNAAPSLVPSVGSTMLNLLAARFGASFANLNCAGLNPNLANPITVITNRDNIVVGNNLLQLFPQFTLATVVKPSTKAPGAGGPGGPDDAAAGDNAAGTDSPSAGPADNGAAANNNNSAAAMVFPVSTVAIVGAAVGGGFLLVFVVLFALGFISFGKKATPSKASMV